MRRGAARLASLPILLVAAACGRPPPEAPKQEIAKQEVAEAVHKIPEPPPSPPAGGSPEPPKRLPQARTCKAGLAAEGDIERLPGQVNGTLVDGAEGLTRMRRAWGDALIVVRGGSFAGADLRGAALHNMCFVLTNLTGSDWRGARARGVGFVYSDLTGARLEEARMQHIRILDPYLERVDAAGADFSDGSLSGRAFGSWKGLRLDGADLRRFRFACGVMQDDQCVANHSGPAISFKGADLRGAEVDTYWGETDWTSARLADTHVDLRQLRQIGRARVEGPLVVREGEAAVTLSPAEVRWLRGHLFEREEMAQPLKGTRPRWMRPGAIAIFAAPPIRFDTTARASALYRRMLPVVSEGAKSLLLVVVRPGGSIDVSGSAMGANAHLCSVDGNNLRYDARTGWFVGTAQPSGGSGGPRPPRPVPLVAFTGEEAEVFEKGRPDPKEEPGFLHFGLCGARAEFERMLRLPVGPAEARRIYARAQNW